jgi:ribosomal protein L16/L10AE
MHALDYIWELELQNRHKHTIWPDHCITGKEDYTEMNDGKTGTGDGRWLDISTRDANFRVINATRGNEVVNSLHTALEQWKLHWSTKFVSKSAKMIDIGQYSKFCLYNVPNVYC